MLASCRLDLGDWKRLELPVVNDSRLAKQPSLTTPSTVCEVIDLLSIDA